MPALIGPAIVVIAGLFLLIFLWRMGREGRRRYEYWKGVAHIWRRNNRVRR